MAKKMTNTPDPLTADNASRFLTGDITWAELVGLTPMAYASSAMVGRYLYQEGKLDEAKLVLQTLARTNPRDAHVWVGLGAVHQQLEEMDLARVAYGRALAIDPDFPEALLNRAEIEVAEGNLTPAVEDLGRIAELDIDQEMTERASALLENIID